jgi:hypothetical protein
MAQWWKGEWWEKTDVFREEPHLVPPVHHDIHIKSLGIEPEAPW